ncbi:MAG: transposase [Thermoplasmatales archaeon]
MPRMPFHDGQERNPHTRDQGSPPVMPASVQYSIERMYCRKCGKVFEPEIEDTFPVARFSMRILLIAAYFRIDMRMSLENVSTTMREIISLRVSEGEVQDMLYRLSESLGEEYEKLLKDVRMAPSSDTDTTSWRENGLSLDLWAFVIKGEAIFHMSGSNKHKVALSLLGKHNGTDIHDQFRAFDTLSGKTENPQQYCWSHTICDAKELESFYGD